MPVAPGAVFSSGNSPIPQIAYKEFGKVYVACGGKEGRLQSATPGVVLRLHTESLDVFVVPSAMFILIKQLVSVGSLLRITDPRPVGRWSPAVGLVFMVGFPPSGRTGVYVFVILASRECQLY